MKKVFLAVLIVGLTAMTSQAVVVYPGVVNEWQDSDFETFIDLNSNGTVEVGEYFAGMWEVNDVRNTVTNGLNNTATYTAVFLLQVTGTDVANYSDAARPAEFTYSAAAHADWTTYMGLTPSGTGTVAMIYDGSSPPAITSTTPGNGSIHDEIASASDGTLLFEAGFTGAAGADEFWYSASASNGGTDPATDYVASLNVTYDADWVATTGLLAHNYLDANPLALSDTVQRELWFGNSPAGGSLPTVSQFQLAGGVSNIVAGADLPVNTNTRIFIHPVPEPSAMLIWGALAGLGFVASRRRRRNAS